MLPRGLFLGKCRRIRYVWVMDSAAVYLLYTTCPDTATAEEIAASLVERRLIACANIMAPMTALFEWEGTAARESEVPMLLKTGEPRVEAAMEAIRVQHPYDCPCIVHWPLMGGHAPFLEWVTRQTAPQSSA